MAVIIAGIYEINEKIGAGGGGVVYLGRHVRLDKKIVLKADKRRISAGTEKLRREVDLLKGLSHTYIPQVYDFVQENGIVYTVMDYVEGESLDRILARGEKIPQKTIVKWACQLLEALSYLHHQKPHGILHGDIKPANIMLRKDGDICLIDFNIALALGEDGAVRVGYSRGYASPEHYGSDGSLVNPLAGTQRSTTQKDSQAKTDRMQTDKIQTGQMKTESIQTEKIAGNSGLEQSTGTASKKIMMDARSDIYSLGATLYHLLSGKKPAEKAADVVPLQECCSPQIAQIITKSMSPDPDRRYQSAEEMLDAFLHLRTNDKRVKKNRRRFIFSAAASALLLALGAGCTFIGMKQTENYETALKLASYSETALTEGNVPEAVNQAMQALHTGEGVFKAPVPAQARKALTDALGVYDLADGFKADDLVELPTVPFKLEVSPEGTRYATVCAYEAAVYCMGEHEPAVIRSLYRSARSDCLFVDEDTIICAAEQGIEAYDIAQGKVLWTGEGAVSLALSGDRSVIAATVRDDDHVVLYRTADGKKIVECSFAGRHMQKMVNDIYADRADSVFALDQTGKWLAVSFSNGGLSVFDTKDPDNEMILYEDSEYDCFSGGFSGKLFAYAAQGPGLDFFGVLDLEEAALIGSLESRDKMLVQTDEEGICLSDGNLLVRFDAKTLKETELAYTEGHTIQGYDVNDGYAIVLTEDHTVSFYDKGANRISQIAYEESNPFIKLADGFALAAGRDQPFVRMLRLTDHKNAKLFSYDAGDEHDEARISADGNTLMLFDYQGFRTYDKSGCVIAKCEFPNAEQIYDQQYIRKEKIDKKDLHKEDSYLEVIWYDGTMRQYGADGSLLKEDKRNAPDQNLEEAFMTDQYRIVSRLHETPKVYRLDDGQYVGELEKDAELTYVTQLDGYIMTEYVSTQMERYGILLDENLQKIAYLPHLCDVYGDTVVFDYHNGEIRSCNIYSLEQLEEMGKTYDRRRKGGDESGTA